MKILALILVLIAGGLGYTYYKKMQQPAPVPVSAPVELTDAEKRALRRQELEDKVFTLRKELVAELKKFNENISYNGQSGYKKDIHGHYKKNPYYYGNRTSYSYDASQPEVADWITGPDFALRRAQELRMEIRSALAELDRLN